MKGDLYQSCADLRERSGLGPTELAKKSGTSVTQIYHAEGRRSSTGKKRGVSAKSLRKIYEPLCQNRKEYLELLAKWAIAQDGNLISFEHLAPEMERSTNNNRGRSKNLAEKMMTLFGRMSRPDQELLIQTARHFLEKPGLKQVVKAWMAGF